MGGHRQLFQHALDLYDGSQEKAFHWLYQSMDQVASFGRTAKFDYLTMLKKLGLAKIKPGLAYLGGATGPLSGARQMLQGTQAQELSTTEMENRLALLAGYLQVGMQEMEDSLCNWQKNPRKYILFSG